MVVGWLCSQGEQKSHMLWIHERLDITAEEKMRKTQRMMGG